jgi:hypothetical protein
MYCMRGRCRRISPGESRVRSVPSKTTSPDVGSISRSTERPMVVLPLPDSPTSPTTSPLAMSKEMFSRIFSVAPRVW